MKYDPVRYHWSKNRGHFLLKYNMNIATLRLRNNALYDYWSQWGEHDEILLHLIWSIHCLAYVAYKYSSQDYGERELLTHSLLFATSNLGDVFISIFTEHGWMILSISGSLMLPKRNYQIKASERIIVMPTRTIFEINIIDINKSPKGFA